MNSSKKFKTIFLHIGLGKTGSTSIQRQILNNADLLENKYDVHFPRKFSHSRPFDGNHSILLRAMFHEHSDVRKRLAALGMHSQESIDQFNRVTHRGLEKSFANTNASNLFLSAESIGHFRKDDVQRLEKILRGWANEIKVVACVRHPVHALSSEIQQRLNFGAVLEELYQAPPFYKFKGLFGRIEPAFGRDNIVAYDFGQAIKSGMGLTAYLFKEIGINVGHELQGM